MPRAMPALRLPALRPAVLLAAALALLAPLAAADALDDIRERGAIRIGVAAFVPWTIERPVGGLAGFEIDIGEKIAEDIGVAAEFRLLPFEETIPALERGEIDMIAAGLAITPERALRVEFTRPYFRSGVAIATNTARTAEIASLGALDAPEIVIVTVAETMSAGLAHTLFPKADLRTLGSAEEAEAALLDGTAHALLASLPEARFLALRHPETVDLPLEEPLIGSAAGFAVRRGAHGLRAFLDAWIVAREADRWLATAHGYWFESLDWADRVGR